MVNRCCVGPFSSRWKDICSLRSRDREKEKTTTEEEEEAEELSVLRAIISDHLLLDLLLVLKETGRYG